jgi:DNA repair exonuclease SbcCD ATPase subunit
MAKQTEISSAAAELREFNKEAASLVSALQDVAQAIGKNAKEAAKVTGESATAYTENSKEAVNLAKELQGYTSDQLKNRKEEVKFNNLLTKTQQNQARIASRIATLEEKKLTASKEELSFIDKALKGLKSQEENLEASLDHAGKLQKTFEKIGKET